MLGHRDRDLRDPLRPPFALAWKTVLVSLENTEGAQRKRMLSQVAELREKAAQDIIRQQQIHKEPHRKGWKKRFSVVSGQEYFEHLDLTDVLYI